MPDVVILTCRHCKRTSNVTTFRDTAWLVLMSAFVQDKHAETRWPILCDECWQKWREQFPATRRTNAH